MPHDSPLPGGHTPRGNECSLPLHVLTVLYTKLLNKVERLETELNQTKQIYGDAFTKLIKKVKKLEHTVQTSQDRRRAKIVVYDDEEDEEDLSKQGRSLIEEMDLDARISLVPPQVSTAVPEVTTADAELNTASTFVSTASSQRHTDTTAETLMEIRKSAAKIKGKAIMLESEQPKKIKKRIQIQMSLDEELAHTLHEEAQARFNAELEAEFDAEVAQKLQEELDAVER
ncbi:hypothetical protein Tco_0852884 [Tanacetum coccineum]